MEKQDIKRLKERLKTVKELLEQDFDERIYQAQRFGYDTEKIVFEYENLKQEKEHIEKALKPYFDKLARQHKEKQRKALEQNESLRQEMHKRYSSFSDEYLTTRLNEICQIKDKPDFLYASVNAKYMIGGIVYTRNDIIEECNILRKHLNARLARREKENCRLKENMRQEYNYWSNKELAASISLIKELINGRRGYDKVIFKELQYSVDEIKCELRQIESIYGVRIEPIKRQNEIIRQQKEREEFQKCIRIELNKSSGIPDDYHAVITDEATYISYYQRNPKMVRNYIKSQIEWEKGREDAYFSERHPAISAITTQSLVQ